MVFISAVSACCALGGDLEEIACNLGKNLSPGMQEDTSLLVSGDLTWTGRVTAKLPEIPKALRQHRSRNNQLLLKAFLDLKSEYDKAVSGILPSRTGIVLGTSTSGLDEADKLVAAVSQGNPAPETYAYEQQELGDPSLFLREYLGTTGPAYTISTACSSSLRALISGKRLIEQGICDVVLAGGADSLNRMTLNGFNAMGLLSLGQKCAPFCAGRQGISIGEGAALMILSRRESALAIAGVGESSDAYHISSPHPEGRGARQAVLAALKDAKITADDLSYINLHGTGTVVNDAVEAQVIASLAPKVPASSTKNLTGHTLGACGAIETALICLLALKNLPPPPQDFQVHQKDSTLAPVCFVSPNQKINYRYLMNNALAFGGNNASIIVEYRS